MNHINSISEIVGAFEKADGEVQVCANAEATYEAGSQRVSVELSALARHVLPNGEGRVVPEPWLPKPQRVNEHLPQSEATDFTRDVFHEWVKTVRGAIPPELHPR